MCTHVLNLLIFICMIFMWPRRRPVGGEGIAPEGSVAAVAAERTGGAAHPSARVFILTLISIVLLNYALVNMLGLKTWRRTAEQAAENYQKSMFAPWQRGVEDQIKLTAKEPGPTHPVCAAKLQAPPM